LVVVASREGAAEAGQKKIKLSRPDRDGFTQGDVESAADDETPCVVAWSCVGYASARIHTNIMLQIFVGIGVGSAKHCFYKGLKMLGAIFQNRAYVVSKQIAAGIDCAPGRARAARRRRKSKGPGADGSIALELPLDPKKK